MNRVMCRIIVHPAPRSRKHTLSQSYALHVRPESQTKEGDRSYIARKNANCNCSVDVSAFPSQTTRLSVSIIHAVHLTGVITLHTHTHIHSHTHSPNRTLDTDTSFTLHICYTLESKSASRVPLCLHECHCAMRYLDNVIIGIILYC